MAKPTTVPRWADDPSALVVEPSSGKKDVGWAENEYPPAEYFNWLFYWIYQWCLWLSGATVDFGTARVNAAILDTDEADVRHAAATFPVNPYNMYAPGATTQTHVVASHTGSGISIYMPLHGLKVGDTIRGCQLLLGVPAASATFAALELFKRDIASGAETSIATGTSGPAAGAVGWATITGTSEVVAQGYSYYAAAVSGGNGGACYGGEFSASR